MSFASDAKLKELDGRVRELEAVIAALKVKLEAVEALTIPRPKRNPRDRPDITKDSTWAQQTTP